MAPNFGPISGTCKVTYIISRLLALSLNQTHFASTTSLVELGTFLHPCYDDHHHSPSWMVDCIVSKIWNLDGYILFEGEEKWVRYHDQTHRWMDSIPVEFGAELGVVCTLYLADNKIKWADWWDDFIQRNVKLAPLSGIRSCTWSCNSWWPGWVSITYFFAKVSHLLPCTQSTPLNQGMLRVRIK